ncbi:hypothetical protein RchiOBHm_Chr6g0279161 [Rosa chinensis]|uniref:Uncharacterized protein n=1 Tax=Rosa chinensis TaxID=74649 RepID=A0A2P6PSX9_ROSCH|nr:hypothetical protein RchiOBHm_Chr6g0279161 [Rosa chinensis]
MGVADPKGIACGSNYITILPYEYLTPLQAAVGVVQKWLLRGRVMILIDKSIVQLS